jgi:hypothetical protein
MSALQDFMNEYEREGVPQASHANHFNQDGESEPEMMEEPEYKPVARKIRRENLTRSTPANPAPAKPSKPPRSSAAMPDSHARLMNAFKAELTAQLAAVKRVGKTDEALDTLFDWYGVNADKLTADMEQASEAMEKSEYDKVSKQFNRFMGQQSARVNRMAN